MIEKIVSGLAKAIRSEFPNIKKIYRMTIEQELDAPAFFIHIIDTTHREQIGGFYTQRYLTEVVYFPDETDPEKAVIDLWEKAEALTPAFRHIDAGDQILTASNEPDVTIIDGVLHIQLEYTTRWRRVNEGPKMMTMDETIKTEDKG